MPPTAPGAYIPGGEPAAPPVRAFGSPDRPPSGTTSPHAPPLDFHPTKEGHRKWPRIGFLWLEVGFLTRTHCVRCRANLRPLRRASEVTFTGRYGKRGWGCKTEPQKESQRPRCPGIRTWVIGGQKRQRGGHAKHRRSESVQFYPRILSIAPVKNQKALGLKPVPWSDGAFGGLAYAPHSGGFVSCSERPV